MNGSNSPSLNPLDCEVRGNDGGLIEAAIEIKTVLELKKAL